MYMSPDPKTKSGLIQVTTYLDPKFYRKVKIFAAYNDMKIREVIESALKEYMKRHDKD